MKYDYDIICIGLGPAGMAVSVMGAEMGLKVCSVEKDRLGGECMNVGCIPSKSLLRIAKYKNSTTKLSKMNLSTSEQPEVTTPFNKIQTYLDFILDKKMKKMFDKVDLIKGNARFLDKNTITVEGKTYSAKKIFLAIGTEPMIPPIEGINSINYLTNKNIFKLEEIPDSMIIIGGGAIGCEMAQAFSRLGTKCSIIQMDNFLIPLGDQEAGEILESVFKEDNIDVYNAKKITKVLNKDNSVELHTSDGLILSASKLLVASGRKVDTESLDLNKANVKVAKNGAIIVDKMLRTTQKNICAVGDCNGGIMLSHAAMHQGMFAIMNSLSPMMRFKYKKYIIPWTVFTEPQVSYVGLTEKQLQNKKIKYKTFKANYADYGAAIAEEVNIGFVKVFTNNFGKIYGVSIIGEGSGEMINEWALAIQKNHRLHDIMFLAHSFPTMGFLSKRVAELWMMDKMKNSFVKKICRTMFRIF